MRDRAWAENLLNSSVLRPCIWSQGPWGTTYTSTSDFQSEVGEVFGEIGGELPAKFGRRCSSFFCWGISSEAFSTKTPPQISPSNFTTRFWVVAGPTYICKFELQSEELILNYQQPRSPPHTVSQSIDLGSGFSACIWHHPQIGRQDWPAWGFIARAANKHMHPDLSWSCSTREGQREREREQK